MNGKYCESKWCSLKLILAIFNVLNEIKLNTSPKVNPSLKKDIRNSHVGLKLE